MFPLFLMPNEYPFISLRTKSEVNVIRVTIDVWVKPEYNRQKHRENFENYSLLNPLVLNWNHRKWR
jgi:hypothetical protein